MRIPRYVSSGFLTMSDTNSAIQPLKVMSERLKNFRFRKKQDCTTCVVRKKKALISCLVTAQLIFAFFLHMQKASFLMVWLKLFSVCMHITYS